MQDFHVHSIYSDGKDTPMNIAIEAINMGLTALGFSDHSYTYFDESYCIQKNKIEEYKKEILDIKNFYKNKIKIYLGIEQDYYSNESIDGYEYVIGSVHYVKVGELYLPIDESKDVLIGIVNDYFNGDIYSLIEEYYLTVGDILNKFKASIIGHFDLISKFNEDESLFEYDNPRYITAWKKAVDKLLGSNALFEINTGAICRGYRTAPFPNSDICKYIREKGGKFILSSDSHSKENLCYHFKCYEQIKK